MIQVSPRPGEGTLPGLGRIVSAMLSAGTARLHASSAGVDAGVASIEEYWRVGDLTRLRKDSRTTASGPGGSTDTVPGRPIEWSPTQLTWLGWTDRLLRPEHLYIWGRPGDDWRLGDIQEWSTEEVGAVVLSIERVDDDRCGAAHIDPHTGRVLKLELPGFLSWRLTRVDDNPDVSLWPLDRWFVGCRDSDASGEADPGLAPK